MNPAPAAPSLPARRISGARFFPGVAFAFFLLAAGLSVEPAWAQPAGSCQATALNRTVELAPDGSFALGNVPVPPGRLRVRVVCTDADGTQRFQSVLLTAVPNGNTRVDELQPYSEAPLPVRLALEAPTTTLTAASPSVQLETTGTLVDGSTLDLTLADSGIFYTSSNPTIATVSPDGLVEAVASGAVLVTAVYEGVAATVRLQALVAADSDGDGLPDDFEEANNTNPGGANLARLPGVTVVASSAAPSFAASRAVDGNALTSWLTQPGDAANRGRVPFLEVVLPTAQRVAQVRLLGNRANPDGFDFLAGFFQSFDSNGNELSSSGVVQLPAPRRDVAVGIDLDGVRRIRFTVTADQSQNNGLAEFELIAPPGGPALDPGNPADAALDFDLDGLSNLEEYNRGTSVFMGDTDGDGLNDALEGTLGTNPLLADTDGDGLMDGDEPRAGEDSDADGIPNQLDPDSDNDGLPDGFEMRLGLNPLLSDTDSDTVNDGAEDFDGDGLTNFEELGEATDPTNPDSDGDGLTDLEELIPGADGLLTDPLRADSDGDGMLDGYESRFGLDPNDPNDADDDPDGDGLSNLEESQRGTDPFNADTVPPVVVGVSPANGEMGLALNRRVIVRFSEPLEAASVVAGVVRLFAMGAELAGTVALSPDGLSVTFTPTQNLSPGVIHMVRVMGLRDRAGNPMVDSFESGFTSGTTTDSVRPTVSRVSPPNGQSGVPVNAPLTVEFSEPMDPATLAVANWSVRDTGTSAGFAGMVQVDASGRTASFVPQRPLPIGRLITLTLAAPQIRDAAGNSLSTVFSSTFTTSFASDNEPPVLVAVSPVGGAMAVPTNGQVVWQFDESLDPLTLSQGLRVEAGGALLTGSFAMSDGNRRITFTPMPALPASTVVTITAGTSLTDLVGHHLAELVSSSFTTDVAADTTRPTVTGFDPASGATGVATDAMLTVMFSEPVNPVSVNAGSFRLLHQATSFVVDAAVTVAANGRSATLLPSSTLEPSSQYSAQLAAEITDFSGQTLTATNWSFTTAAGSDNEPPAVVAMSPPNGALGVPVNGRVTLRLSEPLAPASLGVEALVLSAGGAVMPGTVTLSTNRMVLTLAPSMPLAPSTLYSVSAGSFTDRSGNVVAPLAWSFTTSSSAAADTTRPTVTSISPMNNATGVSVTAPVVWTFSEPIDPGTASVETMPVTVDGFSGALAGSYGVAGNVVTFTPLAPYPGGARLRPSVTASLVLDFAGNSHSGTSSLFTTAAVADLAPPRVLLVTPSDGATDVGPNAQVVLTFSEPIDPATATMQNLDLLANGQRLSATILRSADNRTLTLTATLPPAATVTVAATEGVRDLSGNSLADFVSQFQTAPSFDAGRPSVVGARPGNGATDVRADATVVLYLDEPLDAVTVPDAFFLSQDGLVVPGLLRLSGNGRVVELLPDQPFAPGALVRVFLTSDARDLNGNALNSYEGSFRVAADTTTAAPFLVRTSPRLVAQNVLRNAVVELEYSEPLLASTVSAATVRLRLNGGIAPVVPAAISLARQRVVRIEPGEPLAASSQYFVEVMGLTDFDGQTTGAWSTVLQFFTGTTFDTTSPAILGLSPPEGERGVGVNVRPRLRFSEAVSPLTVEETTVVLSDGASTAVLGSIAFAENDREVVIVPHAPLAPETLYTLHVEGIRDLAGLLAPAAEVSFTTGAEPDTRAPRLLASNPTQGATVPINTTVTLELDEPVDVLTVTPTTFTVRLDGTSTYLAGSFTTSTSGRRLDFVPATALPVDRSFTVGFSNLGIEDFAGNRLTGSGISFSSGLSADATPPRLLAVTPGAGWTAVPINGRVALRFDEPIAATSAVGAELLNAGSPVVVDRVMSEGNRVLTLVPRATLTPLASYEIEVSGITDLAGNLLASALSSTFTTESGADLTRPTIVERDPAAGELGTAGVVRLLFSERIAAATLTASSFSVAHNTLNTVIPGTVSVENDSRVAVWRSLQPLPPSTTLRFTATSDITDLSGLSLTQVTGTFRTAAGPDTTSPLVVALSPPPGAVGVPVNARIAVRFSEVPAFATLGADSVVLRQGGTVLPGTLSSSSDRLTIYFRPVSPLAAATSYQVTVGNITDTSGNPVSPATGSFTTAASALADTTAPTVLAVSPANNTSNVSVTTVVSWTFSEPVDPGSVHLASMAVSVDGFSGVLAGAYQVAGNLVTFTPSVPLPAGVRVRPTVASGQVSDFAGNTAGSSSTSFVTAATADTTPPEVVLVTPSDGATDVGGSAPVIVTFSEPINPTTVTAQNFALLANGDPLAVTFLTAVDNRTVTLTSNLPANTVVSVAVTSGVRDLSGNSLVPFVSQLTTAPSFDASRPSVVSQRPANGGTNVPAGQSVVLYVNEPLDPATVPGALVVAADGAPVPGEVVVSATGRAIEFYPEVAFAPAAMVQVFLTPAATDLAGNGANSYEGSFRISGDSATLMPTVLRTHPAGNATGQPLNTLVELEYSEALDPATVNATTVTLRRNVSGSPLVAATVSLVRGGRVIRLVPADRLLSASSHSVQVSNGVRDLEGQSVAATTTVLTFTSGSSQDSQAPMVEAMSPPGNEASVGVNARVRVRFDESVNPLTVDGGSILLTDGIHGAVPCSLAFANSNREVLIVPHSPLAVSTVYSLRVEGVEDRAGNPVLVATSSFTTGNQPDTTAPVLVVTNPFASATGVPVNSTVELVVNEAVDPLTVGATTFTVRDGVNLAGTYTVNEGGRRLAFVPATVLAAGRSHSVSFSSLGIEDLAGNRLGGTNFSFTTGAGADTVAPQVVDVGPRDGWTEVAINSRVAIRFDEPVAATSVEQVSLVGPEGPLAVRRVFADGNRLLTLIPVVPLEPQAIHALDVGGVEDLAGNQLVPVFSSFTTSSTVDLVRALVSSVTPTNGATAVSRGSAVTVVFSDRVQPGSVSRTSFAVTVNATGAAVPGTLSVAADGRSASFVPAAPLAASTVYRVQLTSDIQDLSGQAITAVSSTFTTGS